MKSKKKLRRYIMFFFIICITISVTIDNFIDFILGFFAGWTGVNEFEKVESKFGDLSQRIGWGAIGIIIIISFFFYKHMKEKIMQPIEQLAENMKEVSRGNLEVQVPYSGEFEFAEIQEAFNYMIEELKKAKQTNELQEKKNQQLYAGIAHDLKTPMTMIMGYAKVLEQDDTLEKESKQRYINTIIEQTKHANVLLDSLLTYSKLENNSYQLEKQKNDIVECIRVCVARCYPMLEEAKVEIALVLPTKPVLLFFDKLEMGRVFTNLITNVVKHNLEKTKCIIQLEENIITEQGKKAIQIVVADNGPKISNDLQDRLFEAFIMGDNSRNTKNGSGLGLSISKKIVERHNGMIHYINEWGNGYKGIVIELMVE